MLTLLEIFFFQVGSRSILVWIWRLNFDAVDFKVFFQAGRWYAFLGGGFKSFIFSPLPGEMIHFD